MEDARQLILADQNMRDVKPVMDADIDIATGSDENDYEIKIRRDRWDERYTYGNIFYIKNTEFGGIIGRKKINTAEDTISLYGRTWRGKLDKKVIRPPGGQDYRKVSGELNSVLNTLVTEQFNDYFVVSQADTGVSVTNYQFDRYCTLLAGITKMLTGARTARICGTVRRSDCGLLRADRTVAGQSAEFRFRRGEKRCQSSDLPREGRTSGASGC